MILNKRRTLKKEHLSFTKPVWSDDIIWGKTPSKRRAKTLAKIL